MNLEQAKEKLGEELSVLLKEGTKVYLVDRYRLGKVKKVVDQIVRVDVGTKKEPMLMSYEMLDYCADVLIDKIITLNRAQFDDDGNFTGKKPRETPLPAKKTGGKPPVEHDQPIQTQPTVNNDLETGYINEKTGKFSREKKRGYVEIKFQKTKKKVALELDEAQIEKLKEMGLL